MGPDRVGNRSDSALRASYNGVSPKQLHLQSVHPGLERAWQGWGRVVTRFPPAFPMSDGLIPQGQVRSR